MINYQRKVILHRHFFKAPVHDLKFSPNGVYIAVTHEHHIQIWKCPGFTLEFSPFVLVKEIPGHYDAVTHLSWSPDSRFLLSSSKDMTTRLIPIEAISGFPGAVLSGHKDQVLGAWFSLDMSRIYTVSRDAALFIWEFDQNKGTLEQKKQELQEEEYRTKSRKSEKGEKLYIQSWKSVSRHYFQQNHAKLTCVDFHSKTGLLACGFSSGIFGIWELPDFINIHCLSMSQKKINSVVFNQSGEWLALGSSTFGQLLVWEWQSESYILKQQSHQYDMQCLAYSQDGQYIATGGDDGKVKLWSTVSGFCFVTFTEHSAGISALEFVKGKQVIFSASLDGTVRAFDLIRYRNFRTFTSPSPVQFYSLAVDPSGEVVCAGSQDSFEIYVWSIQTGKLLDIVSGHSGPVSALAFSPIDGILASASWDKTIKLWDLFSRDKSHESFEHGSEVLSLNFHPNGASLSASTLKGQIVFWDLKQGKEIGSIDGSKDISGGRQSHDKITAENASNSKHFTTLSYTADGSGLIAAGNSKYVCIYDVVSKQLLKKFQISHNLSLDGMHELLNSKNMTEAGPADLLDLTDEESDIEDRLDTILPGAQSGDASLRKTKPTARVTCVRFSPTARSWAASTTEGLMIYALDSQLAFDPFDLELEMTADALQELLKNQDYLKALVVALKLGEQQFIEQAYELIPSTEIVLCVQRLPVKYLARFLNFLIHFLEKSPRIQLHLIWVRELFMQHGPFIKDHNMELASTLRGIQKGVQKLYEEVGNV